MSLRSSDGQGLVESLPRGTWMARVRPLDATHLPYMELTLIFGGEDRKPVECFACSDAFWKAVVVHPSHAPCSGLPKDCKLAVAMCASCVEGFAEQMLESALPDAKQATLTVDVLGGHVGVN